MPIYEYMCGFCDATVEKLEKINDEPTVECPECHEMGLARVLSVPNVHFKGNDWATNKYRRKK